MVVEYLTKAIARVLKEATRGQQPTAHVPNSAAIWFSSTDAIHGHVHHSPLAVFNLLAKP